MDKGYSILTAAQAIGVQSRTIRAWIRNGKIKASKIPGTRRWVIAESEITRYKNMYASEPQGYGAEEVAVMLGVKKYTIVNWCKTGIIKAEKTKYERLKRWIIPEEEVQRIKNAI